MDYIVETYTDVFSAAAGILFASDAEKPEKIEALKEGLSRKFLVILESQLESNATSKWLVGNKISIADFCMASFLFNFLKNDMNPLSAAYANLLLEFPSFGAYSKRLESEMANHLKTRTPKFM